MRPSSSIRSWPLGILLLLLALQPTGCRAFRLEGGFGISLGAEVQVSGLLRGGALALFGIGGGDVYGHAGSDTAYGFALGPLFYRRGQPFNSRPHRREMGFGVLHGLTHRWIDGNERAHPWAFDLTLGLLLFHVRIGFDPLELLGHPTLPSESLELPKALDEPGLRTAFYRPADDERPVVALIIPASEAGVAELLEAADQLFPRPVQDPAATLWRSQVVWVCARAEEVGAEPGEGLVLLDHKGRRRAGRAVDLSRPEQIDAALGELLGGPRGLERRARLDDDTTATNFRRALREIREEVVLPTVSSDPQFVERFMRKNAAWLVLRRRSGEEAQRQTDELIRSLIHPPRPFGLAYEDVAGERRYTMLSQAKPW